MGPFLPRYLCLACVTFVACIKRQIVPNFAISTPSRKQSAAETKSKLSECKSKRPIPSNARWHVAVYLVGLGGLGRPDSAGFKPDQTQVGRTTLPFSAPIPHRLGEFVVFWAILSFCFCSLGPFLPVLPLFYLCFARFTCVECVERRIFPNFAICDIHRENNPRRKPNRRCRKLDQAANSSKDRSRAHRQ